MPKPITDLLYRKRRVPVCGIKFVTVITAGQGRIYMARSLFTLSKNHVKIGQFSSIFVEINSVREKHVSKKMFALTRGNPGTFQVTHGKPGAG